MRLDLDGDGKIGFQDLLLSLKKLANCLGNIELYTIRNDLY